MHRLSHTTVRGHREDAVGADPEFDPLSLMNLLAKQDTSSSGANVKRLEGEGTAAKKALDKSIASKKQEVGHLPRLVSTC